MASRNTSTRFYFVMAVVIAATAFLGFAPTYFLMEWTDAPALPGAVHFHAIVSTGWIVFFVTQTAMIDRGRADLHRPLGIAGLIIALAMTVSAFPAAFAMTAERGGTPEAILRLGLPFVATPLFALLVLAGFLTRKHPDAHKRLMLFATINALTPGLGRLPVVRDYLPVGFIAITAVFVMIPFLHDLID